MHLLHTILFLLPLASLAVPSAPSSNLNKRSITCLKVGASATATWTNSAGQTCSFVGVVGSNYGANSAGNGEYVSPAPYNHEQVSNERIAILATAAVAQVAPAPRDPNCGDAYDAAVDDTVGGLVAGCSQTNPSNSVSPPTSSPVCS
ncbi:hypothetical protein AARAC_006578 [Aspergillus arachidicola]|uniref:DUF8213 domain-containing protein n=1 Tax=Aspergillus arachidicola TaxID=656916 RepID=A0A2G7G951_9EURO|nr:hypothetical protein AARAC_006578 [Aspergillus arachidicola]